MADADTPTILEVTLPRAPSSTWADGLQPYDAFPTLAPRRRSRRVLSRGLVAGALGTTVLNAVTYADMLARGRPASSTPERTVAALLRAGGSSPKAALPGGRRQRSHRLTALGALSGTGAGLAVGVAGSAARALGLRAPAPIGAALVGGAAMAAADVPASLLGVTDPSRWSGRDWAADVVPHLMYGAATVAALRAMDDAEPLQRAGAGLVLRSAVLGIAAGGRASLGLAAPTLRRPTGRVRRAAALASVTGELVVDKLPSTPPRTAPQVLSGRLAAGAAGAVGLARDQRANATLPALAGAVGAAIGAFGGVAWRSAAVTRIPDWQAALLEDAACLWLARTATRP